MKLVKIKPIMSKDVIKVNGGYNCKYLKPSDFFFSLPDNFIYDSCVIL